MRQATVDWCEPNYQWHPNVAEMGNVVSSLALVLSALLVQVTRTSMVLRLLIGIGSILFHATLTYWSQLLDELSMVIYVTYMITILYPRLRVKVTAISAIYVTWSIMLPHDASPWQFYVFQFFFVAMTGACLLSVLSKQQRWKVNDCLKNFQMACAFLGIGYLFWHADNFLCHRYGHYYLHSIWHIFAAVSLTFFDRFMVSVARATHSPTQLDILKHA